MKVLQNMKPAGVFTLKHFRDGKQIGENVITPNTVVTEGKDYMADLAYNNSDTQETAWYLALFGNNLTVDVTDTAATIAARLAELNSEIDEANRPTWTPNSTVPNTGAVSSNSENPAVFTMGVDDTVYGAYFISSNVKAGTAGVLLAGSNFSTSRVVLAADVLQLTYSITLT